MSKDCGQHLHYIHVREKFLLVKKNGSNIAASNTVILRMSNWYRMVEC